MILSYPRFNSSCYKNKKQNKKHIRHGLCQFDYEKQTNNWKQLILQKLKENIWCPAVINRKGKKIFENLSAFEIFVTIKAQMDYVRFKTAKGAHGL